MTFLAVLCTLLAGAALRFYLRNLRLVAKLRQSRSRTAHLRATLDSANKFTHDVLCRSAKRRDALVRVAQYCRESSEVMSILIAVGVEITADRNRQIAERDAVIEKMTARIAELQSTRETSASIAAWQTATFGVATTDVDRVAKTDHLIGMAFYRVKHADLSIPRPNLSRAIRAAEELAELIELLVTDDNAAKAPEEVADIDIVLRGIDAAHGVERAAQVDAKMAKNRGRSWDLTGDGHGQHVESSCADLSEFFDGELPSSRADAFRTHLASCHDCERKLEALMKLKVTSQ